MSSVFDTIKRDRLILTTFLDDDAIRMIRLLFTNTTLEIRLQEAKTETFESNIGSPQGDSLSGITFNIYLE